MTAKRGKRRLKKGVLLALVIITALLIFIFTNVIKVVSQSSISKEDKKTIVATEDSSKNDELKKESVESSEDKKEDFASKKPVIVIDPAFGGEYAGSKGHDGILQKDVNLDIALKVEETLKRYNDIEVYLTRNSDVTVSYEDRIKLIKEKNADVVVSIQQNTEGTKTAEGVETYILSKNDYPESDSGLGYAVQKAMTMYSSTKDRGLMTRNIDILKDAYKNGAVGAVIYTGFITNEKESKDLTNDKYTRKLGEGIAQGILSYVDKKKAASE